MQCVPRVEEVGDDPIFTPSETVVDRDGCTESDLGLGVFLLIPRPPRLPLPLGYPTSYSF